MKRHSCGSVAQSGTCFISCAQARPNPVHKRSPLIALTSAGARRFEAIRRAESELLKSLRLSLSRAELARLADDLETLSRDLGEWLTERDRQ